MNKLDNMCLISCPGGEAFAKAINEKLIMKFGPPPEETEEEHFFDEDSDGYIIPSRHTLFSNGEFKTEVRASLRGKEVFIVQDCANEQALEFYGSLDKKVKMTINDQIFDLIVTIDAVRCCSPKSICLIIPTYPYSRQHRRSNREGIAASRIGMIFETMNIDRIITLDIHSKEIENCFNKIIMEDMHASYQILRKLLELLKEKRPNRNIDSNELTIVAPDTGAISRSKFFSNTLHCPLAILYKERNYAKVSKNAQDNNIIDTKLLGDVEGKTVFIVDDMLGTGGTLINSMPILRELGAKEIYCAVSLPMFNGNAEEHFATAYENKLFDRLIGTNAIYTADRIKKAAWYEEVDVSDMFAQAIANISMNNSVSHLLDNRYLINKLLKFYKL